MKRSKYRLIVQGAGSYEADSVLLLVVEVVRHRFWHWKRGDGWVD